MGEVGLLLEYSIIPPTKYESNEESKHGWKLSQSKDIKHDHLQTGAYPGASAPYNMSQPAYPGYPPQQPSGGYPSNWDQSSVSANQQNQGYDYYSQPPSSQQQTSGGAAAPADSTGYNYSQAPASGYNQQGQGYSQDGYGGYQQPGYGQPPPYDQQQGYTSAPSYSNVANPAQEGHAPIIWSSRRFCSRALSTIFNGAASLAMGVNQLHNMGAMEHLNHRNHQPIHLLYGQSQQSPSTTGGYGQPTGQPGYPHSQPLPSGYVQPDSGSQSAPPSSYGATGAQPGYAPPYGAPPAGQPGYGQGPPPYSSASYGSGYSQPAAYSADGNATSNARGTYESAPASQTAQQSGVAKASPQS
ncbi:KH DOMAIN CONTAINING RNA BINDING PROTEIN [Salix purpurea]|uniref:KH DOMAIN CONTAINING RNA BINDING PROTEIN n=1 Tax=Salix purpurea TaxID=77065 RepID=A0A9Q0ULY8_SALPP|nr:KH DOMAIN CONTAINING RNA BINDING PROTEIN [Salix purpurea]